jgi:hypothetical protein
MLLTHDIIHGSCYLLIPASRKEQQVPCKASCSGLLCGQAGTGGAAVNTFVIAC